MKTKKVKAFLWLYIFVMTTIAFYLYGILIKSNGDNIEHLHSSWLIWQGYIPYKDFFQHHNPLLWYMFSPLVAVYINDFNIFPLFNIISICCYIFIIYFQCKILLLNKIKPIIVLFFGAIMVSSYSILLSTDYRPDTFMYLFLFIGLYFLFLYQKDNKLQYLSICFLSFFVGFMFTQKILLNVFVPAIIVIYWIIKKQIKMHDIIYSLLLPISLFLLFLSYLYTEGALEIYLKANFYFNSFIPDIFYKTRIVFPPTEYFEFYVFIPLGILASVYFIVCKSSYIEKTVSMMFIEETVLRIFYFSSFLHYSIMWLILGIMLTIMIINKINKYNGIMVTISAIYLFFIIGYHYHITYKDFIKLKNKTYGYELAFSQLTPCDYAINGYYATYNLKAKDVGYYSILPGQIDVLGEKLGIAKRDNLNYLIIKHKPKIISIDPIWDTYWEQRGKKLLAHKIDENIIKTYYEPTKNGYMFILKKEYQKHNCIYDGNEWRYMD